MPRLKELIREVHRRSLWQVLALYGGASWIVFEIVQTLTEGLALPGWFPAFAFVLLLLGLPIVLATAFVQERRPEAPEPGSPAESTGRGRAAGEEGTAGTRGGGLRRLLTWRNALLGGMAAFALWGVVAAGWLLLGGTGTGGSADEAVAAAGVSPADPARASLAVLPFANMSAEEEDRYFTDGIHDEILAQLSKIGDLKVISRTSVMEYRDTEKNVREIADELGVGYVLEGGVRRFADRVRITAQLIDAAEDEHLWAETYERSRDDLFAIQADVARRIAASLEARLSPEEERRLEDRPTGSLEAYDHYLRGRVLETRSAREPDLRSALEAYGRAVEIDPAFALAHARMGTVHLLLYWYGIDRTAEQRDRAREAIDRALELDPDLPEARMALGQYYYHGERRYEEALEELERAEGGVGNPAYLHLIRGAVERRRGDFEAAVRSFARSLELDPRSAVNAFNLSLTYMSLRRWEEAERSADRALTLSPGWAAPSVAKAWLRIYGDGDVEGARAVLERAEGRVGDDELPLLRAERFWVELMGRDPEAALRQAERISEPWVGLQFGAVPRSFYLAEAHHLLGDMERARVHFDSARAALERRAESHPDEIGAGWLAWIEARLGNEEEAVRLAEEAVARLPLSRDALDGDTYLWNQAAVYAMVGRSQEAIEVLERILSVPSQYSRAFFRLHPVLDPLRDEPAFRELVSGRGP